MSAAAPNTPSPPAVPVTGASSKPPVLSTNVEVEPSASTDKRAAPKAAVETVVDYESSSDEEELPPPADPDAPGNGLQGGENNGASEKKKDVKTKNATAKNKHINVNGAIATQAQLHGINTLGMPIFGGGGVPVIPGIPGMPRVSNMDMDEDEEKEDKPPRERASRMEYKRLDELYNKAIHDFYLAESSSESSAKEDKWEEFLFIVRRRFDWQNKYQKTFVDIKSNELRNVLKDVLAGIVGVSLVEDKPTVEPNLLFNYLPQLEAYLEGLKAQPEPDERTIKHLELLIEYINADYAPIKKRLYPLLENNEITFDLLWALFLPNTIIYTICPGSGEPRCLKLDWGEQKETMDRGKFFQLDCYYVDYDGKIFGEANAILEVEEFRGARKIDSLRVFPLAYHPKEAEIRDKLIKRGMKFGELKGMHYRMYKGLAFFKRKRGFVKVNVNGRVMIDPSTFRRINPNYKMAPVKDFDGSGRLPFIEEDDDDDDDGGCCGHSSGDEDDDDDEGEDINLATAATRNRLSLMQRFAAAQKRSLISRKTYVIDSKGKMQLILDGGNPLDIPPQGAKDRNRDKEDGEADESMELEPGQMNEEELLLCSPTVLGFSFTDKLWLEFAVSHIHPIAWNKSAFDSLVLPEAQKNIVKALVESHTSQGKSSEGGFDDVIKGKGKGLVAVLHGRPGVGKTLTAEGISEYLQRPLYMVGAGELGTDARTLEQQLSKILDVAHIWNAVLLLDEADVFLERRSVHDLQRNALVSIFLRLLEYFQGILFLTTNRVETFDEAFQSRIHIALRYSDLDKKAKRQIWKTFLAIVAREEDREGEDVVTKEELEDLARRELNGRQIKNCVRTAKALADSKKERLAMSHLKTVLEVIMGFERDLKGLGQVDSLMSYA